LAGLFAELEQLGGARFTPPPATTAHGALLSHITRGADSETFQPMNVNFGLLPPLQVEGKRPKGRDRKKAYTTRALADFDHWLGHVQAAAE
jgi:methylenetetrahydrofolate--tRNA-(uracil-5-)-methyltransferase